MTIKIEFALPVQPPAIQATINTFNSVHPASHFGATPLQIISDAALSQPISSYIHYELDTPQDYRPQKVFKLVLNEKCFIKIFFQFH